MHPGGQQIRSLLQEPRTHAALIILLGLLVYSNTLTATFHFDDHLYITNNDQLRDLSGIWPPIATRWFGYLTFTLNYRLHGLDVAGYHVVNIAVHILAALLVYALVDHTFRTPLLLAAAHRPAPRLTALIAALLFVSHPVQTQAVTYISQRFTSLAAMLYLLALVAYVRSRLAPAGSARYLLYALSLAATVLAMKTKEIAFTLPFALLLYELFFLRPAEQAGGAGGERLPVRQLVLRFLPYAISLAVIPVSLLGPELGWFDREDSVDERLRMMKVSEAANLPPLDYLLTQFRVIVTYIRLLVLPVGQNLDYDYPVFRTFFTAGVALSFLLLCLMAAGAMHLYRRSRTGTFWMRLPAFGMLWFFLTLSVESSIIPIQDVIFEHRLYLPSAGAFAAVAAAVVHWAERLRSISPKAAKYAVAAVSALVIGLSGAAYARNAVWQDDVTLWTDVVSKSPAKAQPRLNLGTAYNERGMFEDAVQQYQRALDLDPRYAEAHNGMGLAFMYQGMIGAAEEQFMSAIRLRPDYAAAHYNLGLLYLNQGQRYYGRAREELERVLRITPVYRDAGMLLRYLESVRDGGPAGP